jgi:hypothetical protein
MEWGIMHLSYPIPLITKGFAESEIAYPSYFIEEAF